MSATCSRLQPLGEHHRGAHPAHLQEPGREPEAVEERERQQHPVDRRDRGGAQRGGLRAVGQQRAVRQPDPARHARGARRVDEQRDVLARPQPGPAGRAGGEIRGRHHGGADGGRAGPGGVVALGRDHERRAAVGEHDVELRRDRDRAVRHHDRARAEGAEHGDAERRAVAQPHDHAVARGGARRRHAVRLGGHRLVQLGPRERVRAGHVDDGGLVGHPCGVGRDEIGDVRSVHGSPGFSGCSGGCEAVLHDCLRRGRFGATFARRVAPDTRARVTLTARIRPLT